MRVCAMRAENRYAYFSVKIYSTQSKVQRLFNSTGLRTSLAVRLNLLHSLCASRNASSFLTQIAEIVTLLAFEEINSVAHPETSNAIVSKKNFIHCSQCW